MKSPVQIIFEGVRAFVAGILTGNPLAEKWEADVQRAIEKEREKRARRDKE